MNRLLVAAFLIGLDLALANAQTAPEAGSTPPAPAAQPPATELTGKEVREHCRVQAEAQGLKGPARKAAVNDCFAKARPDLAKREQCREKGKAQGLADKPLSQFVKQCAAGT